MRVNKGDLTMKKIYTEEYLAANNIDLPLSASCSKCGETKHRQSFSVQHRHNKYTIHPICGDCNAKAKLDKDRKTRIEDPLAIYPYTSWTSVQQRTTNSAYSSAASIQSNYQHLSYLKKNIKLLITKEEWVSFWNEHAEIVKHIVSIGGKPSIDRIDKMKDYTLDNIRIISQERNLLLKFEQYANISDEEAINKVKKSSDERKQMNAKRYAESQKKEQ